MSGPAGSATAVDDGRLATAAHGSGTMWHVPVPSMARSLVLISLLSSLPCSMAVWMPGPQRRDEWPAQKLSETAAFPGSDKRPPRRCVSLRGSAIAARAIPCSTYNLHAPLARVVAAFSSHDLMPIVAPPLAVHCSCSGMEDVKSVSSTGSKRSHAITFWGLVGMGFFWISGAACVLSPPASMCRRRHVRHGADAAARCVARPTRPPLKHDSAARHRLPDADQHRVSVSDSFRLHLHRHFHRISRGVCDGACLRKPSVAQSGGYVFWIEEAFGEVIGAQNMYWCVLQLRCFVCISRAGRGSTTSSPRPSIQCWPAGISLWRWTWTSTTRHAVQL